ncbi:MAG TPA: hypothetical protein VNJ04_04080 [Gemmatimonadaceae bacterium]|nr:hypothetical protein [Gemmatimonadaceae bacterium]
MSILPGGVPFPNADRPKSLQQSIATLNWIHSKLHGQKIPKMPTSKRMQLAGGCWHVTIEHSMAIVVLVDQSLHGSALALVRPLFESYIRGMWLMHAATDAEVDAAGRDEFPRDINKLTRALRAAGASHFTALKEQWWKRLCSLTHTGYQQIGARLTPEGLGYAYDNDEIAQALGWADGIGLLAVVAFAGMAEDHALAQEALNYMRAASGEVAPAADGSPKEQEP